MLAPATFMIFTALLASAFQLPAAWLAITPVDSPTAKHQIQMKKPAPPKSEVAHLSSEGMHYFNCSPNQALKIQSAVKTAQNLVNGAFRYLKKHPEDSTPYRRWFGPYDKNRRGVIVLAYARLGELPKWNYDCSCTDDGLIAQVDLSQPRFVRVCPRFWSAPMGGENSAAFALIREGSRFKSVLPSYEHALGQLRSLHLAHEDPEKAARNSDTYGYFAMEAYMN